MRQVILGGANSLDNYLARPNHAVDWLAWSDEVAQFMAGAGYSGLATLRFRAR